MLVSGRVSHTLHGTGIFTYMNGLISIENVSKYTSPMEHLGVLSILGKLLRDKDGCTPNVRVLPWYLLCSTLGFLGMKKPINSHEL